MIYSILLISILSVMHIPDTEKMVTITVASPKKAGNLERKGYAFPTERIQKTRYGFPSGWRTKYILPHTLDVRLADLPPGAAYRVSFTCADCGGNFSTKICFYNKRTTEFCRDCATKRLVYRKESVKIPFGTRGKHYWKKALIQDSVVAACDISNETDKRFLCVHHLKPRHLGGKEERDNVVVITANYHQAYHQEMGNNQSEQVNKESYLAFKARELQKLAALRSHTQGA